MDNSDTSSSNETTERKASRRASGNQTLKTERNGDQDETSHSEGNEAHSSQAPKDHKIDHAARSAFASHCLKNTILDEVLSEKKKALLHSPEVLQFLKEKMNK